MNLRFKWKPAVAITLVLGLAYCTLYKNPATRAGDRFVQTIKQHLKKEGDWIKVADVYPGDWSHVCALESESLGGGYSQEAVRERFKISYEYDLNLPYGVVSTSDSNWGVMFFYPPNKVEALYIHNKLIFGSAYRERHDPLYPACQSHENAIFLLRNGPIDPTPRYLTLTTKKNLKKLNNHTQEIKPDGDK